MLLKPFNRYKALAWSDCIVCSDYIEIQTVTPVTKACQHMPNTCSACMGRLIKVAVAGGKWSRIYCPDTSCKEQLDFEDVRKAASPETFIECVKSIFLDTRTIVTTTK